MKEHKRYEENPCHQGRERGKQATFDPGDYGKGERIAVEASIKSLVTGLLIPTLTAMMLFIQFQFL